MNSLKFIHNFDFSRLHFLPVINWKEHVRASRKHCHQKKCQIIFQKRGNQKASCTSTWAFEEIDAFAFV